MTDHSSREGSSVADARLEWISQLQPMPVPVPKTPFVRTRIINNKKDGCFICARKSTVTRHHIRHGERPVCVFLCWKHHQIAHGTALDRFKIADLRTVMAVADRYNLWKVEEKNMVRKRILMEIRMRVQNNNK